MGQKALGSRAVRIGSDQPEAFPLRSEVVGTLTSLRVYLDRRTTARQVDIAVYANLAGHPGRRLFGAVIPKPHRGTWNQVSLRSIGVRAGEDLWIALLTRHGTLYSRTRRAEHCVPGDAYPHRVTKLPSNWRSDHAPTVCALSMYAQGVIAELSSSGGGSSGSGSSGSGSTQTPGAVASTPSAGNPAPCPLTHAAGADGTSSCWATHTGVQAATGFSEAQIEAGAPGFTHVTGTVTVTQPGTVISHEWISGCVAIESAATDVTISDSLITPNGTYCTGGDHGSQASAINNGNITGGDGLLIENTTVDGGNASGDTYGISVHDAECLSCDSFGFAKEVNTAQNLTLVDSYVHDVSVNDDGAHDDPVFLDSATGTEIEGSYIIGDGSCNCDGGGVSEAVAMLQDYGKPDDNTVTDSYLEGDTNYDAGFGCGSGMVVTNNAFSNDDGDMQAPAVWFIPANPGNRWSGNYIVNNSGTNIGTFAEPLGSDGC